MGTALSGFKQYEMGVSSTTTICDGSQLDSILMSLRNTVFKPSMGNSTQFSLVRYPDMY
jgi:hypothetical protein